MSCLTWLREKRMAGSDKSKLSIMQASGNLGQDTEKTVFPVLQCSYTGFVRLQFCCLSSTYLLSLHAKPHLIFCSSDEKQHRMFSHCSIFGLIKNMNSFYTNIKYLTIVREMSMISDFQMRNFQMSCPKQDLALCHAYYCDLFIYATLGSCFQNKIRKVSVSNAVYTFPARTEVW